MKYLAVVNDTSNAVKVFGDGNVMRNHCIKLLDWALLNNNEPTSITKISDATDIPRMSIHWILWDAGFRKQKSLLARVARQFDFNYEIDRHWRTKNKNKRAKPILKVMRKRGKLINT